MLSLTHHLADNRMRYFRVTYQDKTGARVFSDPLSTWIDAAEYCIDLMLFYDITDHKIYSY